MDKPTLVFFDTETVGLPENYSGDIIIQLAGVVLTPGGSTRTFNCLANPNQLIAPTAMEKHCITSEMIQGLPPITATKEFAFLQHLNTLDNVYFVCYNMAMDVTVLKRVGLDITKKTLDIWRVVKLLNMNFQWEATRLPFMIYSNKLYNRRVPEQKLLNSHDALFDSYDLMILYKWLEETYKLTIESAYKITHNPLYYQTVPFGSHRGKKFTELNQNQLSWMRENIDDPDIQFTLDKIGF